EKGIDYIVQNRGQHLQWYAIYGWSHGKGVDTSKVVIVYAGSNFSGELDLNTDIQTAYSEKVKVSRTYPVKTERVRDMNKKWMIVIISFLLMAAIIGAGGKIYIDKRAEQKEAEEIEVERMSVEALKNTFEDIKSVEFEKSGYNNMTGYYSMNVIMTNKDEEYVRFDFMFSPNHPNEIDGWGVKDKENVQKEGRTKSKVEVIYT